MTDRDSNSTPSRAGDETVATSSRSRLAAVVAGLVLLVLLVGAGRLLVRELSGAAGDEEATASPTTTPIAREPQIPIVNQGSVEVRDGPTIEGLALGAPPGTRIAFGSFQGPVAIVDLSDGSTVVVDDLRPVVMTDNYLVAQPWDDGDGSADYSLVVVNLRAKNAAKVWWNASVQNASSAGDGDRVWIGLTTDDGTSYLGFNLATNNGQIFEVKVPGHARLAPNSNGKPYVNAEAAGVYAIADGTLEFVRRGLVLASSAAGEVWWRCDEALACTATLTVGGSQLTLPVDRLVPLDGVFALSDDARYFAYSRPDWAGVTVFDRTTGSSTDFENGRVWDSSGLAFVGDRLIVGGELGLEILDLQTGQTKGVEGLNSDYFGDYFVAMASG